MRFKFSRCFFLSSAAVLTLAFFVPQRVAAQESGSPNPKQARNLAESLPGPLRNLKTSVRGPLQRRLEAAYPDSFREGVDIFLEPGDGWVSPEVFDWWSFRVDPDGLTPYAAERMFLRISGREPIFPSAGHDTSCAVVGASRNLLGSRYGPLIDAHDVVFRVNRAHTEDFVADVGERTTHHVAWPTDLGENQADRRAFLLFNPMTLDTPSLFDRMLSLVENDLGWDPAKVRVVHPEFVRYLHQNWMEARGGFPSTGFIALMIAVHVCDEVDVFGFGADAEGRWDRYYEDDPAEPTDLHPADFEGEFRREMDEKGILRVFLGNRSENGVDFPGFQNDRSEHN
jgi:hypothetical protein